MAEAFTQSVIIYRFAGGKGVEDIGRDHMVFSGNRGRTSLKAMKGNHGKLTTNEEGGRGGDHKKFAEPYGGHVT